MTHSVLVILMQLWFHPKDVFGAITAVDLRDVLLENVD
jgi:hypothetical protein